MLLSEEQVVPVLHLAQLLSILISVFLYHNRKPAVPRLLKQISPLSNSALVITKDYLSGIPVFALSSSPASMMSSVMT